MRLNAPNIGMPHLAYLTEDVGEKICLCKLFPRGVGTLMIFANPLKLHIIVFKHLWEIPDEFHRYPYLPVTHCAQQGDVGICRQYMYNVPQV